MISAWRNSKVYWKTLYLTPGNNDDVHNSIKRFNRNLKSEINTLKTVYTMEKENLILIFVAIARHIAKIRNGLWNMEKDEVLNSFNINILLESGLEL